MKKIILLTAVLACSLFQAASLPDSESDSGKNLKRHVMKLASMNPFRNADNMDVLNLTAEYIKSQFISFGYDAYYEEYAAGNEVYRNVVCTTGNADSPVIVIGAHYDVCGNTPGADDNASGIAGMLELARLFSKLPGDAGCRLEFAAFSTEEPPYFGTSYMGSAVHSRAQKEKGTYVKLAVVLEMIGYYSESKNSQQYPLKTMKMIYPARGDFIAVAGRPSDRKYIDIFEKNFSLRTAVKAETLKAPSFVRGVDFSDQRNYWKDGFNAVMITDTAFYRNPNYHRITDTAETLDFDKMSEVVKGVFSAVIEIRGLP